MLQTTKRMGDVPNEWFGGHCLLGRIHYYPMEKDPYVFVSSGRFKCRKGFKTENEALQFKRSFSFQHNRVRNLVRYLNEKTMEMQLGNGITTQFDAEHYPRISGVIWYYRRGAARSYLPTKTMSRFLLQPKEGYRVIHISKNQLDNRMSNLSSEEIPHTSSEMIQEYQERCRNLKFQAAPLDETRITPSEMIQSYLEECRKKNFQTAVGACPNPKRQKLSKK